MRPLKGPESIVVTLPPPELYVEADWSFPDVLMLLVLEIVELLQKGCCPSLLGLWRRDERNRG